MTSGLEEVRWLQADRLHPEVLERVDESLSVVGIDHDPDIEILGRSRVAVRSKGVAADDQEPDLTSDATLDELDEILGQDVHRRTPD